MTAAAADWKPVANQLGRALAAICVSAHWNSRPFTDVSARLQDADAQKALTALADLQKRAGPSIAERLAQHLMDDVGSSCEELEVNRWVCIECGAEARTEAQVAHEDDCVLDLAEQVVKGAAGG